MSLFSNLLSLNVQAKPSHKPETVVLVGSTRYELEILVEEGHQTALEAIGGPRARRGVHRFETARLILEDKNARDKNAVRVEIRGKSVGYLQPRQALLFRQQLFEKGMPGADGQCQALISGGWVSSDGRKGPYEVWLDLPSEYQ